MRSNKEETAERWHMPKAASTSFRALSTVILCAQYSMATFHRKIPSSRLAMLCAPATCKPHAERDLTAASTKFTETQKVDRNSEGKLR